MRAVPPRSPLSALAAFGLVASILASGCGKTATEDAPAKATSGPMMLALPRGDAGPDLLAAVAPSDASASSDAAAPAAPPSSAAARTADAGAACGEKGQPDCPLQEWMKRVVNRPFLAKDAPAVADAFDKMVPLAPPGAGYPNWVSISKDGAKAARAGDLDAAKAACRGCHEQYKRKYKTELRQRPL